MELAGGLLVVLGPFVALVVLLVVRTRQLWPRRPVTWTNGGGGRGGDLSGDREPRRPTAPVGAGAVALPEPGGDQLRAS